MHEAEVITYHPSYRQNFIDLNTELLEKYFKAEPHDINVFDNLEEIILKPGGEIFFCLYDNQVAGTVAMQKIGEQTFELAKMAVTEKYKGKGFSNLLMESCIHFAKEKKASKIILLSNKSLSPAITLYSKFGFKEVPLDPTDYSRANIQMELLLK
jgi:N-acetylglutamate synthase-like GNAT family acetyltransferase